jgi:hypothetical protein
MEHPWTIVAQSEREGTHAQSKARPHPRRGPRHHVRPGLQEDCQG